MESVSKALRIIGAKPPQLKMTEIDEDRIFSMKLDVQQSLISSYTTRLLLFSLTGWPETRPIMRHHSSEKTGKMILHTTLKKQKMTKSPPHQEVSAGAHDVREEMIVVENEPPCMRF